MVQELPTHGDATNKENMKPIRFHAFGQPSEVIAEGVTLAEAQAHCNDPKTRYADKSFDSYELED